MRMAWAPSSRKASAILVAVYAARIRAMAGWSDVEITTTERASPSGPRSSSMNSRTSRPRSPTRAITVTSASVPRAIIDSREDFPTPDPAKSPTRWPRPTLTSVSRARTPSGSGESIRSRPMIDGGAWSRLTGTAPVSGSLSVDRPAEAVEDPSEQSSTGRYAQRPSA